MPLSLKAFTQVMQSLPEGVSQDQINSAAKAAEEGTPLEHLWATINRPLVGSPDALISGLRHEHGADEGVVRKTAEDFGAALTSPVSLATTAAGVGAAKAGAAGLLGVSKAARVAEAGLQAPLAAEGVRNLIDGETPGAKLAGGAQALLAGAGVHGALNAAPETEALLRAGAPQAQELQALEKAPLPELQPRGAADASAIPHTAAIAGAPGSPAGPQAQLALSDELAALINQSHEKGGSTTSLTGGKLLGMEDGKYMLSPYHDRQLILDHPPTPQELRDYSIKNSDLLSQPGHNLGTWNNAAGDGKHYVDVSIAENDLEKASELARKHNQLAIFDMVNGQDVPILDKQAPTVPAVPQTNEQVFGERAKQALVDGPVNTLDKLHSIGVPGAAEDAARIRNENPGRNIASTAMSVAAPAAASQIDDSDPNDPNYNLKHYGKLALDIGGAIGLGNTAIMAAKRATELPLHKNAAARGAGLMLLSTPKREWVKTIAEMGVEPKDMPKIRAASEKLLATQAAKAESKLTSTKQLLEFLDGGKGEGADWYNTQKELEHYFGKDAPIMANLIAATSNNSTVKSNLTLALKAYAQHKADPEAPIEGLMKTLLPAVQKSLAGEELNGRKVHAFSKALLGDPDAVVVDRWMMRAFGFKGDVPTASQYDVIEHAIKDMAKKQGITPREAQAQLWFGVKGKAEAGKGRAPSPPYGSILQQKFGPTQPQDVESTLVDAQARWKQKPKKGFTSALQAAILGKKDALPLD